MFSFLFFVFLFFFFPLTSKVHPNSHPRQHDLVYWSIQQPDKDQTRLAFTGVKSEIGRLGMFSVADFLDFGINLPRIFLFYSSCLLRRQSASHLYIPMCNELTLYTKL